MCRWISSVVLFFLLLYRVVGQTVCPAGYNNISVNVVSTLLIIPVYISTFVPLDTTLEIGVGLTIAIDNAPTVLVTNGLVSAILTGNTLSSDPSTNAPIQSTNRIVGSPSPTTTLGNEVNSTRATENGSVPVSTGNGESGGGVAPDGMINIPGIIPFASSSIPSGVDVSQRFILRITPLSGLVSRNILTRQSSPSFLGPAGWSLENCTQAALLQLTDGYLLDGEGNMYSTEDVTSFPFQSSSTIKPIFDTFSVASTILQWTNSEFPAGNVRFCRTASGLVYSSFDGEPASDCELVELGFIPAASCSGLSIPTPAGGPYTTKFEKIGGSAGQIATVPPLNGDQTSTVLYQIPTGGPAFSGPYTTIYQSENYKQPTSITLAPERSDPTGTIIVEGTYLSTSAPITSPTPSTDKLYSKSMADSSTSLDVSTTLRMSDTTKTSTTRSLVTEESSQASPSKASITNSAMTTLTLTSSMSSYSSSSDFAVDGSSSSKTKSQVSTQTSSQTSNESSMSDSATSTATQDSESSISTGSTTAAATVSSSSNSASSTTTVTQNSESDTDTLSITTISPSSSVPSSFSSDLSREISSDISSSFSSDFSSTTIFTQDPSSSSISISDVVESTERSDSSALSTSSSTSTSSAPPQVSSAVACNVQLPSSCENLEGLSGILVVAQVATCTVSLGGYIYYQAVATCVNTATINFSTQGSAIVDCLTTALSQYCSPLPEVCEELCGVADPDPSALSACQAVFVSGGTISNCFAAGGGGTTILDCVSDYTGLSNNCGS